MGVIFVFLFSIFGKSETDSIAMQLICNGSIAMQCTKLEFYNDCKILARSLVTFILSISGQTHKFIIYARITRLRL